MRFKNLLLALALLASFAAAASQDFTQNGAPVLNRGSNTTSASNLDADDALYFNVTAGSGFSQIVLNPDFNGNTNNWANSFEDTAPTDANTLTFDTATFTSSPGSAQKDILPARTQDFTLVAGTADQTLSEAVDNSTTNTFNWSMKFDALTNPTKAQWALVCSELFGTIGGAANRRLYWCLVVDGSLPADTADIKYIQVGNGSSTVWQNFSRDVGTDISNKYGTASYSLSQVKLVTRMMTDNIPTNNDRPDLTAHFDDVKLFKTTFAVNVTHSSTANVSAPINHTIRRSEAFVKVKSSLSTNYQISWVYNGSLTTNSCSPTQSVSASDVLLNCSTETSPELAVSAGLMTVNLVTPATVTSAFTASENRVFFRLWYPNLTTASISPGFDPFLTQGQSFNLSCTGNLDPDFSIADAEFHVQWRPTGGNFTDLNASTDQPLFLDATTAANPVNATIPANGANTTSWKVSAGLTGAYEVRCRIFSPSAGQVFTAATPVSVVQPVAVYYEHGAVPGQFINTSGPLGVRREYNTTIAPNTEALFLSFDKDVNETGSGTLLSAQNATFVGWFNSTTPAQGFVNWQLNDVYPNGTVVQICRTPTGGDGQKVVGSPMQRVSSTCSINSDYLMVPGHRLRVSIYVFNSHGSQFITITHQWDLPSRDSSLILKAGATAPTANYFEHAAAPGHFFNSTLPFGTQQYAAASILPNAESPLITFDKDVNETGNGLILAPQSVAFIGFFNSTTPALGFVNWQLLDVYPNGTEVEICRTPTGGSGQKIVGDPTQRVLASCVIATEYQVAGGHRLRIRLWAFNGHGSQNVTVTHFWDTDAQNSGFILSANPAGTLSIDLVSPGSDLQVGKGSPFTAACQVTCTGGACPDALAFIQFHPDGSTNFTDMDSDSSKKIILGSGESNPRAFGTLTLTQNATFALIGNLESVDNILRCRGTSRFSNATGATQRKVTVTGAFVRTDQSQYLACAAVIYRFEFFDANDAPADSSATVSLLNTTGGLKAQSTNTSSGGIVTGSLPLPSNFDAGEWTLRVLADGTVFKLPFLMGEGSTDYFRIDLAFSPNSARYKSGQSFSVSATVWNLKGNGVNGLWPSKLFLSVDSTPVSSGVTDQGNGTYSFTLSTTGLTTNAAHAVTATAADGLNATNRKAFYVIP